METTSWELIHAAAGGDEAGRTAFVARYSRGIRRWLQRRWTSAPHSHAIDDAVQEVFMECFKPGGALAAADPDRDNGFRSFLRGVVTNVARRYEKRLGGELVRRDAAIDAAAAQLPETTLSRMLDREWARGVVREAAREQEERARGIGASAVLRVELLRLRFHDGLSIRDIAAELQLDPAFVHHQYAKARRDFRKALGRVLERRSANGGNHVEALIDQLMELLD
jgi:RNA polymerase sigma-70 factor (ECF subfamily)